MNKSRSQAAFEFSADRLPSNRKGHLYLWTFTVAECMETIFFRKIWSTFLERFRQRKEHWNFSGLRVFEMHETHGLHSHVLTANYLRVNEVRALWKACGGGRIDVLPIPFERRYYLAKYLSKSKRPPCLKGVRLWDAFGGLEVTRCKDIEFSSDWTRAYKALVASIEGFSKLAWAFRQQIVQNVLGGYRWCAGLGGLEVLPVFQVGASIPGNIVRRQPPPSNECEPCFWP